MEGIERGHKVFYRCAGPSIVDLTFQSLLGGMASPRVVVTLTRTGRRLFSYILQVTHSLDSIPPGGAGFASFLRVRFLRTSRLRGLLAR